MRSLSDRCQRPLHMVKDPDLHLALEHGLARSDVIILMSISIKNL